MAHDSYIKQNLCEWNRKTMNEEQTQPIISKPCPECGGQRVQVSLSTISPAVLLQVTQQKRKTSLSDRHANQSYLAALTCTTCGYTILYAVQPSNLLPDEQ